MTDCQAHSSILPASLARTNKKHLSDTVTHNLNLISLWLWPMSFPGSGSEHHFFVSFSKIHSELSENRLTAGMDYRTEVTVNGLHLQVTTLETTLGRPSLYTTHTHYAHDTPVFQMSTMTACWLCAVASAPAVGTRHLLFTAFAGSGSEPKIQVTWIFIRMCLGSTNDM